MMKSVSVRSLFFVLAALILAASTASAEGPFQFFSVTPCRIADTRGNGFTGTQGPPALSAGAQRNFRVAGLCGIPAAAKAAALNVTVVTPSKDGFVSIWPYGAPAPLVSTINFAAGEPAIANGAIVPLSADPTLDISVIYGTGTPGGSAHLVLDVTGYFCGSPCS